MKQNPKSQKLFSPPYVELKAVKMLKIHTFQQSMIQIFFVSVSPLIVLESDIMNVVKYCPANGSWPII